MKIKLLRLKKLSWKLTILYALLFSLVLVLLSAGILYGVRFFLVQQSIHQVESSSDITARMIIGTPGEQLNLSDHELLSEAQLNSDTNIKIADPQGKVINASKNFDADGADITSRTEPVREAEIRGKHLVVKNQVIRVDGKIKAYLQVTKNMEKEYAFMKLLFVMMAAADAFGIAISVLAGYIISKRMLKPIDRITKTAKKISITDLNSRIDEGDADDELTRLAVTFNDMIGRLRVSFEKQNQFVSDASHELRTPISVIQGYISLIDRWGKADKDVLDESIEAIKNETGNMMDLVERLLFLARGDVGRIKLHKEKLDIGELIEAVIKESRLIAPERILTFNADEKVDCWADKKMIVQMLRALIDNSIKFTPQDGEISLSAEATPEEVRIAVRDTGVGIPQDEIRHIFDRFYRVDKARAKETGGSGLGLAIVKWIVEAHRGTISAESKPGKGTDIIILIPRNL